MVSPYRYVKNVVIEDNAITQNSGWLSFKNYCFSNRKPVVKQFCLGICCRIQISELKGRVESRVTLCFVYIDKTKQKIV